MRLQGHWRYVHCLGLSHYMHTRDAVTSTMSLVQRLPTLKRDPSALAAMYAGTQERGKLYRKQASTRHVHALFEPGQRACGLSAHLGRTMLALKGRCSQESRLLSCPVRWRWTLPLEL